MLKMKIALALTAGLCVTGAGKAHAWVQFCNATDVTISTVFERFSQRCDGVDGSLWEQVGWWNLAPGQCAVVFGSPPPSEFNYYYAEGAGLVWSGPFQNCTPFAAHDLCDNSCFTPARILGFRELNTGTFQNYTLTFTH